MKRSVMNTVRVILVALVAVAALIAVAVPACKQDRARPDKRPSKRPSTEATVGSAGEAQRAQASPLVRMLPAAIAVAEVHGRSVALLEHTYPGVPAVRATDGSVTVRWPGHLPRFKFYGTGNTSRHELATLLATSEAPYATAAVAYLAHMETGLVRIEALQLYLARDDYRDDAWAKLLEEDGRLRAWFDEHRRRLAALRAAIDQAWAAELTDGAEAQHPAIGVWGRCQPVLAMVDADDPAQDDALRAAVEVCRGALTRPGYLEAMRELSDDANRVRREPPGSAVRAGRRRQALVTGLFATTQLLASWLGDDKLLPPPAGPVNLW
ncbi:MAG: hypothetical protein HS111_25675 [Kofleriaceae bacterium]|nr:hypothetical protein [Kofleriaceae bacterium]MCL4223996.1 hypothetical protein [Myxococcales bacterium]